MSKKLKSYNVQKFVDSSLIELKEASLLRNSRGGDFNFRSLKKYEEEDYIESVTKEINIRLVSIKKQTFEIGGLLLSVKQILGEKGKANFGTWIEENFPFSHKTANNYMIVYKLCA